VGTLSTDCPPSTFQERLDEGSSGFSMNYWFSLSLDYGLTYDLSCEISTMGASVDEDTHEKSWMACSPMMLGKNGGVLDERESSFTKF